MADGRAIVESSTADGVLLAIDSIRRDFSNVSATEPVQTHDGRFISSVRYSNNQKPVELELKCGLLLR